VASRAEAIAASRGRGPAGVTPGLGAAVRLALSDGFYHSWRLVPANLVWAAVAVAVAFVAVFVPLGFVALPVLALPTAGIFRVTTRIARGEAVSFWDAVDAWRTDLLRTLGLGALAVLAAAVLTTNTIVGFASETPIGWSVGTLALWGVLGLWLYAWTAWPILLDPDRIERPLRDRLRLAGLLVLAHPVRIGILGIALAVFLAVSTVAIVALVSVSVSFAALVATRLVLPAADRLEERLRPAEHSVVADAG
jgi:uncharacterized membrane protein YesL